jgi:hypothetical protein
MTWLDVFAAASQALHFDLHSLTFHFICRLDFMSLLRNLPNRHLRAGTVQTSPAGKAPLAGKIAI